MKKLLSLLVLLALVLGVLPLGGAALAQGGLDVNALAQYFPGGTVAYAALRTDDAYLDELDGLLGRVVGALPAEFQAQAASINVHTLLDQAFNADFATDIRPWLGDSMAFGLAGLEDLNDNPPIVLALEVADRDMLLALLESGLSMDSDSYERSEDGDAVRWTYTGEASYGFWPDTYLDSDVLLISNAPGALDTVPAENGLSSSVTFNDTLGLLPTGSYNIVGYVDLAAIAPLAAANAMPGMDYEAYLTALGQAAIGLTALEGRVLTIDVVQNGDSAALAAMGVPVRESGPVDPAFARYLPANAQYVIHGTDLAATYQDLLTNLSTAAAMQGGNADQVEQSMAMLNFMLQGALDLDLEDDLLGWMTGDYALLLGVDPALVDLIFSDPQSITGLEAMPVYLGLVAAVTDPAAAQNVISQLAANLPDLLAMGEGNAAEQVQLSQETIGGGNVLVITLIPPDEQSAAMLPPLELLVGANDAVFALGTRNVVAFALQPGQDSLAAHPDALDAADYYLPDSNAVALITGDGVQMLVDLTIGVNLVLAPTINNIFENIVTELDGSTPPTPTPGPSPADLALQQAAMIRDTTASIVGLISNLTMSASGSGDAHWMRLTLALTAE